MHLTSIYMYRFTVLCFMQLITSKCCFMWMV